MRGHIVKRYKGSWSIVIDEDKDPETGKRKQRWITVKGTKRDAEKELNRILSQKDNGIYVKPERTTLKEYLESWLRDYCTPNLSPNSTETYNIMVHKHILPDIGELRLTELKPQHIQKLISKIQGAGLNRTAQYVYTTLHRSLKIALKQGTIARNPVEAVEFPKVKHYEFKTMNEEDISKFLDAAKKTEYYALFYCALFCGMRRSELLALQWQDVDLYLMQISVNRTLHQLMSGEIIIKQPKTNKSRRLIALSPSTCAVLREHMEARKKHLQAINPDFDPEKDFNYDELVFCKPDGSPYRPDSVTHAWINLVRRNGLTGVRLHDARHSMASIMLKNGTHPKIVQERLGHAKISTTLDTYSHVAPGLQAAAANKLDEIVLKHEDRLTKELNEIIR